MTLEIRYCPVCGLPATLYRAPNCYSCDQGHKLKVVVLTGSGTDEAEQPKEGETWRDRKPLL